LGFGVPASGSQGRRAASQAGISHMSAGGIGSVVEDYLEMDALLRQVEARDLIEFGMIPVCFYITELYRFYNENAF